MNYFKMLKPRDEEHTTSVLSSREQRVYGLVHIFQGLLMLVWGKRSQSVALGWIMEKAQANHEQKAVDTIIENTDWDDDDFGWDGCPHGVIEGRCAQCMGITEERRRELSEQDRQAIYEYLERLNDKTPEK